MFKVQENKDGSTSIFCRSSGKLICVIKGHRRPQSSAVDCCITCPIGVGESLSNCKSSVLNNGLESDLETDLDPLHLSEDVKTLHLDEDRKAICLDQDVESITKIQTRPSKCCISPIPVRLDDEPKEDYYDDCITQEEFARCLNLVPTAKFDENSMEKLKAEFPLRHLSRTAAFVRNDVLREIKLLDDTPLTSRLGGKILNLNPEKNFFNEQAISMAIKKYDSFCRFPVNTAKLVGGNFPKLRCREIKEYPVCIPLKVLKVESAHIYTFGKRQRLEKKITMRTGLDKRSRRLLSFCSRRKCVVQLRKLTKKEIVDWTSRKPQPPSLNNICASYDPFSEPLNEIYSINHRTENVESLRAEISSFSNVASPDLSLLVTSAVKHSKLFPPSFVSHSSLFLKNCLYPYRYNVLHLGANDCRECVVKLYDIKRDIHKVCGEYYVKGTRIRVPFYSDYVNMLVSKKLFKINNFSDSRNQHSILKNDHAYHRPFIKEKTKLTLDSLSSSCNGSSKRDKSTTKRTKLNCSAQKTSISLIKSLKKSTSSVSSNAVRKKPNDAKPIPVVDLTDDSITNSPVKPSPVPVLSENLVICKWMFHCFGCGHKCLFYDKSFTDTAVTEHMQIYHSVSEPSSFLTSYLDRVNKCAIIEAFPGYKSNSAD